MIIKLFFSAIIVIFLRLFKKGRISIKQFWAASSKVQINKGAQCKIEKGLILSDGCRIKACSGNLSIGQSCFFNNNCCVTALNEISIGHHCKFANNLVIVDHDHDYRNSEGGYIYGKVTIGNNVWVGANCVILKNTVIGDGCVIAAGSVVRGTIQPNTVFYQKKEDCVKNYIDEQRKTK